MSKKKKKSSVVADNLIESLMDDLKDIQGESSFNMGILGSSEEEISGFSTLDDGENRVDNTNIGKGLWKDLAQSVDPEGHDAVSSAPVSDSDLGEEFESPVGLMNEVPTAEESRYDGPSADFGYQSSEDLISPPFPSPSFESGGGEDKTISIPQDLNIASSLVTTGTDADKTLAVDGFANARLGARKSSDVDVKVSVGHFRGSRGAANVLTSVDASLVQAENLKLAQQRILELEKEVEFLRAENEELGSAGEIIRARADELSVRISSLEKEKIEIQESAQSEIIILKGNLQYKESEVAKARIKVEELETRLKSDFKKIRVRERELENRLELLRAEKSALVRSKDEYILEQKRKIDQLSQELDNYRKKCLELNKTIEANQDQVKRTERALRLALTNLEAKEENLVPLKKAE